ncbi:uncharacterized protein BT62DRAFT_930928 [Guyanagaster necrorhizus]|uniref:Uncharacterized protein n=1 Tax=Guyanagaster necrorhizus TaxID=856835 RepID=A0A9P7VVT6_9AGAR|nr:uncharacterized protein BT62DRAFT_930928 [Guyanagaster necrorhizus MCA 3950]KAG7447089.1 hypothetical protein BT62DRAFT_930928 [Guyanagaster necrorhizus MCA 3950]
MHSGNTYACGFETKSLEYLHQEHLEDRRLKGRIYYHNRKFKEEVSTHLEWSHQELLERTRAHEAFINNYTANEKRYIKNHMREFEENERRQREEQARFFQQQRSEEEARKRAEEEQKRSEWYQQQRQRQEDEKKHDEDAYA